ncbi:sugar phosphate isomerase/epimerase family protein [Leucobacter sp. GX24907]
MTGIPVLEAVERIRSAGFDGAELNAETLPWAEPHLTPDTPWSVVKKLAATEAITSVVAHREGLANPDPDRRVDAVAWTLDLAKISVDLGAPLIHVIPGDEPGDSLLGVAGARGEMSAFVDSLRRIIDGTRSLGVAVGLEPIVRQLVSTTDAALEVLQEVPDLGISFDPSHLEVTTHDVDDAARRLGSKTLLFALKDAQGTSESFSFPKLGTGDIDFASALRILLSQGFSGPVVVEHEAHVFGDKRGIDEVLRQSYEFTSQLLADLE